MKPSTIGYLTVTDYDKFIECYTTTTLQKIEYYKSLSGNVNIWSDLFDPIPYEDSNFQRELHTIYDHYYQKRDNGWYSDKPVERFIEDFKKCFDYISEFNQKFNILYKGQNITKEQYYLLSFGQYMFLIFDSPYISTEFLKDYSNQTIAQIRGQISDSNMTSLVPSDACNMSLSNVSENITDKQSALDKLKQEMSDVKSAKTKELAVLQAEIDAKVAQLEEQKRNLMSVLEKKQAELQSQMKQLENQLFVLESEIYAIRCFLGEVINFTKIKSGVGESADKPIILFQKMRYLDEEMGKLCSIYDFDGDDLKLFEKFIATNEECLETFCPANKCISLVRCTKSGYHHAVSGEIANMLCAYEAYHGKTIGILIRDGENLYIGWTDEEKVNIKEDMFFAPGMKTYSAEESDDVANQSSNKLEIVSRYFVFSILQGILENSDIIKLDGKHSFVHPDNMIIYSTADNWIVDNKYGSFADLLDKYSKEEVNKIGDEIIVIQGLRPDRSRDTWFNSKNDRGIGYGDRTHDVSTSDGEIHKINHILSYPHYYIYYLENNSKNPPMYVSPGGKSYHYKREIYNNIPLTEEDIKAIQEKDNITVLEHGYDYNYEYFISLFKDLAWDKTEEDYKVLPKANFQIYHREYVNMTFFNSVWITYIIQNKNIGKLGWSNKGPDVDYAYVIKYLNIMRKHLLKREEEEAVLINEYMSNDLDVRNIKDWQVMLSEWKFNNNVHNIGKRAAKQFAKYIEENK